MASDDYVEIKSPQEYKEEKEGLGGMCKGVTYCQLARGVILHGGYFCFALSIISVLGTLHKCAEESYTCWILVNIHLSKLYATGLGIGIPFLLSIRALVTLETDDDRYWLTYWVVFACYAFATIMFEEILFENTWIWYAIQGSVYLWLYFPCLDGCLIISDTFLKPWFLPGIAKISKYLRARVTLSLIFGSLVNVCFVVALFFFLLPFCSTYIGCTLVGICYPTICSARVIADKHQEDLEQEDEKSDKKDENPGKTTDSQWLTYWIVFAIVHFVNVWYDNLLDQSYWFKDLWYKFCLPFVVWLQIPFFHGAEYIFLRILCPVFGLHVHQFHYSARPWENPRAVNFITYTKNIEGFIHLVQGIDRSPHRN